MKIKIKKEEQEVIIEPEDRTIISSADEKLNKLTQDDKELIESIIERNLNYCNLTNPNPFLPSSISKSLETVLNHQAAANFLLEIISNPKHIKIIIEKLKKEGLIGENASKFIFKLSSKYGEPLRTLILNIERPHDWIGIVSEPFISGTTPKLRSRIWRADGEMFQFTSTLEDGIIFTLHIVKNISDTINRTDKERILDLDKYWIDELEKNAGELKKLYESVKSDIEKIGLKD